MSSRYAVSITSFLAFGMWNRRQRAVDLEGRDYSDKEMDERNDTPQFPKYMGTQEPSLSEKWCLQMKSLKADVSSIRHPDMGDRLRALGMNLSSSRNTFRTVVWSQLNRVLQEGCCDAICQPRCKQ